MLLLIQKVTFALPTIYIAFYALVWAFCKISRGNFFPTYRNLNNDAVKNLL